MASIFFNFGTEGSVAGETTYYFDDVNFGEPPVQGIADFETSDLNVFPNPTNYQWTILSKSSNITLVEVFDIQGKLMLSFNPNSSIAKIDASNFDEGIYFSKISTNSETSILKLLKR